jgi:hypothetical protein
MEKASTPLPFCPLWSALHDFLSLNENLNKTFSKEEVKMVKNT